MEMRNRKNPAFSRVHYSTAFRLAGQYMVERNWQIVIVLLISVSGKHGALGALSVDMTQANSTLPDDSQHDGQSVRFLYNKSLNESGTNIQLVGYRYSTSGYFNFADTTYSRMNGYNIETQDGVIQVKPKFTDYYNLAYNKRGKLQLTVTQQLGRTSTLYLSGSHQTYWGTSNVDEQFQAGLNTAFEDINWTLSYSLTKTPGKKDGIRC